MTKIFCDCCCKLKLEELPNIEIEGMEPDGGWVALSDCCFVRRYDYIVLPPRQVISTDLKRSTWHETFTEIYREVENNFFVCPNQFDCKSSTGESYFYSVERLGLLYELQYVDVYIQKIRITCPSAEPAEKIIVSTRNYILYKGAIAIQDYGTYSATITDVATNTVDFTLTLGYTPDWDDPAYWVGYWVAPEHGEFWSNKIFDSIPDDNEFNIDGCFEPCESIKFCATNCDGLCVVGSASEGEDFLGIFPICSTTTMYEHTDVFVARFNGQDCTYSRTYFSPYPIDNDPPPRLTGSIGELYYSTCGKRKLCMHQAARTLDTECVSLEDQELCLQTAIALYFPPIDP